MFDWYIDGADSPLLWGLRSALRFHANVLEFAEQLAAVNFANLYRYWEMGGEQWIATVAFNSSGSSRPNYPVGSRRGSGNAQTGRSVPSEGKSPYPKRRPPVRPGPENYTHEHSTPEEQLPA